MQEARTAGNRRHGRGAARSQVASAGGGRGTGSDLARGRAAPPLVAAKTPRD